MSVPCTQLFPAATWPPPSHLTSRAVCHPLILPRSPTDAPRMTALCLRDPLQWCLHRLLISMLLCLCAHPLGCHPHWSVLTRPGLLPTSHHPAITPKPTSCSVCGSHRPEPMRGNPGVKRAWGRRSLAPTGACQETPVALSC